MRELKLEDIVSVLSGKMELYKLISLAFHYPALTFYNYIKEERFSSDFRDAWDKLENGNNNIWNNDSSKILSLEGITFDDFESNYISDFEVTMPQSGCSLYERHYVKDEKFNTILLELKAFYKNFELKKAPEFEESEDHIVLELEFMHYLIYKELQAVTSGIDYEPYQKCRYDFIKRHLIKWIPELSQKATDTINSKYHKLLILVLKDLVNSDFKNIEDELNIN